jgi:predicted DCC family thiol-disulfide oxidoreductase YuxK
MNNIYILYDAQNEFCLRCRAWLATEPALLPLEFIPYQAPELLAKFEGIQPYLAQNSLLAVTAQGAVYTGPQAFIMCLYALENYRDWAARLSDPALLPYAAQAVGLFASFEGTTPPWVNELNDKDLANMLKFQRETTRISPLPHQTSPV